MTPTPTPTDHNGVYRKWLHLYLLARTADQTWVYQGPLHNVDSHVAYPWIWEEQEPAFDALSALWHITGFDGLPEPWTHFWFDVRALRRAQMDKTAQYSAHLLGPYWAITNVCGVSSIAQTTCGMKNAIRTDFFRRSVKLDAQQEGDLLQSQLRPYLVNNLGEEIDETERTDQKRRGTVQQWHGPPPNRPPGSRQV